MFRVNVEYKRIFKWLKRMVQLRSVSCEFFLYFIFEFLFVERLKDSRKVDSLAFILLLFLQSFHQIDLKSTLSRDEFVD
jgi:hypothetical protein